MTALLELRDIRRSYPSGDGSVEVLKGITLQHQCGGDGGDRGCLRLG
ncbi:macrolide export ATP-binding/permease MacB [Klebsiella variicola]|uniref:Macrolide export ATP-binding/permease MacB n=1 Tax=Klebsiella variicola TaxID=244366 RepID=A0A7H4MGM5_KLEVA|nr:macrolide export ATP-binding/permease MacB [Klebsiella variicola]